MYKPKNFAITELIGRKVYEYHGDYYSWFLLDETALRVLQALRDEFGPCVVNDWNSGGKFRESGLRNRYTDTGAHNSAHKFGRAFDCKFKNYSADEVREAVLKDEKKWLDLGLTRFEDGAYAKTWFHFDTMPNKVTGKIQIIKP